MATMSGAVTRKEIADYLVGLLEVDDAENGPRLWNARAEYDGTMQARLADGRFVFIRIDIEPATDCGRCGNRSPESGYVCTLPRGHDLPHGDGSAIWRRVNEMD